MTYTSGTVGTGARSRRQNRGAAIAARPYDYRRPRAAQVAEQKRRSAIAGRNLAARGGYQIGDTSELGFSLKPPKWLRNDVRKVGKFVKKHETALAVGAGVLTAGILAPGAFAAAGGALVRGSAALARGAGGFAKGVATDLFKRSPARGAASPAPAQFIGPVVPTTGTSNPDAYNGTWDAIFANPHARAESAANDPEFAAWAQRKAAGLPPLSPPAAPALPAMIMPATPAQAAAAAGGDYGSGVSYGGGGAGGGAPISSGDNPTTSADAEGSPDNPIGPPAPKPAGIPPALALAAVALLGLAVLGLAVVGGRRSKR